MAASRLDELRRRVAADPDSPLFATLAEEHRRVGEFAEAVRVARTGLGRHPGSTSARLTLGRALLSSGDARGAREELVEAVRQAPEGILGRRYLGQAFEAEGNDEAAREQYAACLLLAPGEREAVMRLAAVEERLRQGRGTGAVPPPASTGGETDGDPPPLSSVTLAELYLRQGHVEDAVAVYRRVLADSPENERAREAVRELEGRRQDGERPAGEARRRALQLTIGVLESMLGAARRR